MRATVIAVALIAASSVSAAPIPLIPDESQSESPLHARGYFDGFGDLSYMWTKTSTTKPLNSGAYYLTPYEMRAYEELDRLAVTPGINQHSKWLPKWLMTWRKANVHEPGWHDYSQRIQHVEYDKHGNRWVSSGGLAQIKLDALLLTGLGASALAMQRWRQDHPRSRSNAEAKH